VTTQFQIVVVLVVLVVVAVAVVGLVKGKGKAIPAQGWKGPEGSRTLRLPDFMTFGT